MSSELKTNKISPATGTEFTLGDSGDTFTLPSGGTLTVASGATIANSGTATGFGSDNTPVFQAHMSTDQGTLTDNTYYKCSINTETIDSDGAYDTSAYRFTVPSGEGGKYYIFANVAAGCSTGKFIYGQVSIYKNGSNIVTHSTNEGDYNATNMTMTISAVLDLSAADYLEMYAKVNTDAVNFAIYSNNATGGATNFGGFKLI